MEQTPVSSRSFGVPLTIVVVGMLVASLFLIQRSNSSVMVAATVPVAQVLSSDQPRIAGVRVEPGTVTVEEGDSVLGNADAPTTIFLFSQFHCAYCRHFFEATFPQLKAEILDTGRARLVFKVFPIGDDEQAVAETERAARGAYCAARQEAFWPYVQRLSESDARYEVGDLVTYAEAEALDREAFEACLASEAAAERVAAQIREGVAAGIVATPTFVINDLLYEGDLSSAEIDSLILQL